MHTVNVSGITVIQFPCISIYYTKIISILTDICVCVLNYANQKTFIIYTLTKYEPDSYARIRMDSTSFVQENWLKILL